MRAVLRTWRGLKNATMAFFNGLLDRIGPDAWTGMLGGNEPVLALYRQAGLEVVFDRPGNCEGYACQTVRLALPTSRMRDPDARRCTI